GASGPRNGCRGPSRHRGREQGSASPPTSPPPCSPGCSASTSRSPSPGNTPPPATGPPTPPTTAAANQPPPKTPNRHPGLSETNSDSWNNRVHQVAPAAVSTGMRPTLSPPTLPERPGNQPTAHNPTPPGPIQWPGGAQAATRVRDCP